MNVDQSERDGATTRRQATRALTLLALTSFMSYLDRMVLPTVSQPIKLEFGLSDTQIGLLNGLAFIVLYAFSGVPLSRLADRTSRTLVLAASLAFWSVATAACGLARSFGQLVLARACVGIGESACQPVGYAVVGEHFPPDRRTTAIAWFLVGNSLGITAGFMIGGWLGSMYGGAPRSWLSASRACCVIALARLPRRGAGSHGRHRNAGLLYRSARWVESYRWLIVLNAVYTGTIFGPIAWLPAFFMRSHGLPIRFVGTWTGIAIGFGMGFGMLSGGFIADRLYRRGRHCPQWLGMITVLLSALVFVVVLLPSNATAALAATFAATLLGAMGSPVNATSIQNASPPELRATGASLATLAVSLIGIGLAPYLIGALSDRLSASLGTDSLRFALLSSLGLCVISSLLYFYVAGVIRDEDPLAEEQHDEMRPPAPAAHVTESSSQPAASAPPRG